MSSDESDEAVRTLVTGLRWSFESRRGGLLIHEMVSLACGGSMQINIWHYREDFSDDQCEILVTEIADGMTTREDFTSIMQRDQAWVKAALGWFGRLEQVAAEWENDSYWRIFLSENTRHRETASLRLTALELLLACHHREHQQYPDALDQLDWPQKLAAVKNELMEDPFHKGERLVYQKKSDEYLLYSVGPDGLDQQGFNSDWVPGSTKPGDDIQLKVMNADW